jgi:hypothetical protein
MSVTRYAGWISRGNAARSTWFLEPGLGSCSPPSALRRQMKHDPRQQSAPAVGAGHGRRAKAARSFARPMGTKVAATPTDGLPTGGGGIGAPRQRWYRQRLVQRETYHGLRDHFAASVCHVRNGGGRRDGFVARQQGEAVGSTTGNASCSVRRSCDRLTLRLMVTTSSPGATLGSSLMRL